MLVMTFYTVNTAYEKEFEEFSKLAGKFEVPFIAYPVESKGNWLLNCSLKPSLIRRALDEQEDDILYLDSDARIQQTLPQIKEDRPGFCVWDAPWRAGELLSGTIYFPNNELSRNIIDEWIAAQNDTNWKEILHQRKLEKIYKKYPHFLLSHDWVNIAGKNPASFMLKTEFPLIIHTQASRKHRNTIR